MIKRILFFGGLFLVVLAFFPQTAQAQAPPCGGFGDINGDGAVTVADATLMQQIIAGFPGFTPTQIANADVNGDGTVSVFDTIEVAQYISGARTTFSVCGAGPLPVGLEPPPTTLFGGGIPTGTTTGAGFVALIFNVIDWLFVVVLLAAIVFIVLAGLQFIQGGGDPSAVTQARNKLIWGVVGIAVAVFARTIPAVVRNIIGG